LSFGDGELRRREKAELSLVGKSLQLLLAQLGKRKPEGKNEDDHNSTSTKERWFFGNSGSGGTSRLLRGKLPQSGVAEMLVVWEIRESLAIGDQTLAVHAGIVSGVGRRSGGELQGVAVG